MHKIDESVKQLENPEYGIPTYIYNDYYGWLCTSAEPVFDDAGKPVALVGVDISMDEIQNILGEHVSEEISNAEFIVNSKGVIVAHSDPELIGRNINDGDDKLFKAVSGMTGSGEKAYKYLDYDGRDYLLYSVPLENEWTCISVIDGSDDFGKLHISLYITIFIVMLFLYIYVILLVYLLPWWLHW